MHPVAVRTRRPGPAWRAHPGCRRRHSRGESLALAFAPTHLPMPILPKPSAAPSVQPQPGDLRRVVGRAAERLRPIPTVVEPAPRAPERPVEAEPDYRQPTPRERGRLLLSAYEATTGDATQRLLIAELMAQYRTHCLRQGLGDPFPDEVPARAMRVD